MHVLCLGDSELLSGRSLISKRISPFAREKAIEGDRPFDEKKGDRPFHEKKSDRPSP
ncbi:MULTISPECIES: hypothetical protein [unclassified Microcoleus]|uniref:hypothetical protein n=1 Tax=unclassified Microcoleus TaxID=2642155 RepID=UPI001D84A023|nr:MULTISPECIES: hypothetical protein [unclassified Microcoleus]MCC3468721.1 hypothetical protein [Microcoleus sp. PH2017_06_SFM_O_A]MCC3414625.1 hypothetical protein [Microcoleus sp. PH2017_02_FOX_O_A]MCC3436047.1 hypothetical protein [Microcoleus sp. PH2017_05_CCC_O_A]MCC3447174.1 hypothetical protein [Microcoleus sp. PH2017_09_SFU_O_A]MCC3492751.1 hypothetical protein [Microcoleus sp. PH2017_16_JOR_D_A]